MSTRAALALLALASLFLSRRSPSWRPLSASLLMLAAIDVARLLTAPHAALREWGWWQADVMLCALWPVAIGVGLLRKDEGPDRRRSSPCSPRCREYFPATLARLLGGPPFSVPYCVCERRPSHCRPPCPSRQLTRGPRMSGEGNTELASSQALSFRLASLCSLAFLLGALRPYLPRAVYLAGLRLPRWALAGLWVEAVALLWIDRVRRPLEQNPRFVMRSKVIGRHGGVSRTGGEAEDECGEESGHEALSLSHAPLACSLILAACNTADLVAGAWLVAPWQPPAWQYARAVTWAAYAGVGVVMGWDVVRRSRS